MRQLLAAVVGDASAVLRRQVLSALCDTPALEHYLAQPDKYAPVSACELLSYFRPHVKFQLMGFTSHVCTLVVQ